MRILNWLFLGFYGAAAIRLQFGPVELSDTARSCTWAVMSLLFWSHGSMLAALYFPKGPLVAPATFLNAAFAALLGLSLLAGLLAGQLWGLAMVPIIVVYYFNARIARRLSHELLLKQPSAAR